MTKGMMKSRVGAARQMIDIANTFVVIHNCDSKIYAISLVIGAAELKVLLRSPVGLP